MANGSVTVIHCSRCGRTGQLVLREDRFWCAWCQDWAAIVAESVENAMVDRNEIAAKLSPRPATGYPLQALRITAGWTVDFNNGLFEIDPDSETAPREGRWMVFTEDMLQLRHERTNRLLDLGWYPEGDLESGEYRLVVYERDFRGRLLHEFRGRDRAALVAEIERLLMLVSEGKL